MKGIYSRKKERYDACPQQHPTRKIEGYILSRAYPSLFFF